MKPAMFEAMTHVLGAPKDWDAEKHGECGGLPVAIDHANSTFTSCWQLDPEEVAALINGGRIYVTVVATGQPPMALAVK